MPRTLNYTIENEFDGKKVISYLRGKLKFSARLVTKLKNLPGGILLDNSHIRTIDLLRAGSVLTVNIPDDAGAPESLPYPLDIVFEDDDILVINKPVGLAMHPTHNHQGDTLANAVAWHLSNKGKSCAFRSIGRLDKGTSGLVLCALNSYAASRLTGDIGKTYLALCGGRFAGSGTIDSPIIRPDPMKTLRGTGEGGVPAITHWRALAYGGNVSLLRISLETGRTHQIRVHFASVGAPLLGDDMYGGDTSLISRPALHCDALEFIHPVTREPMRFSRGMPGDMEKIIKTLAFGA